MGDVIRDAVICEPVRTPIGRYGGMFKSLTAVDLGVAALKGLLERTGVAPDDVEDVILGHCYPSMEAPAIGRVVALDAGLPVTVPGMQLDRRCGSGLQAVIQACMQVGTGQNDLVVAGGAESMSNAVFHSTDMRWGGARGGVKVHDALNRGRTTAGGRDYPVPGGMIETAENLRRQYGIPREEQDELAVDLAPAGGRRAEGRSAGRADHPGHRHQPQRRRRDRHRRASPRRHLGRVAGQAQTHSGQAGSGSHRHRGQLQRAERRGVDVHRHHAGEGRRTGPDARWCGWCPGASPGCRRTSWASVRCPRPTLALGKAGLTLADIDLIELNEAFAAQALAVMREWKFTAADLERTNVHGSGISLGHPVGATGGRMLATLARELHRRDGRYGLETMCIGGGQGLAAVFERVRAR